MPWLRLDVHWYQDPKIEEAAEDAGPLVLAAFPVLLCMAKAQMDGGRCEFTYRGLSHILFAEKEQVGEAIRALVSAGVLSCPVTSDRGAVVAFDPGAWKRWNDADRKAASRNGAVPHG